MKLAVKPNYRSNGITELELTQIYEFLLMRYSLRGQNQGIKYTEAKFFVHIEQLASSAHRKSNSKMQNMLFFMIKTDKNFLIKKIMKWAYQLSF